MRRLKTKKQSHNFLFVTTIIGFGLATFLSHSCKPDGYGDLSEGEKTFEQGFYFSIQQANQDPIPRLHVRLKDSNVTTTINEIAFHEDFNLEFGIVNQKSEATVEMGDLNVKLLKFVINDTGDKKGAACVYQIPATNGEKKHKGLFTAESGLVAKCTGGTKPTIDPDARRRPPTPTDRGDDQTKQRDLKAIALMCTGTGGVVENLIPNTVPHSTPNPTTEPYCVFDQFWGGSSNPSPNDPIKYSVPLTRFLEQDEFGSHDSINFARMQVDMIDRFKNNGGDPTLRLCPTPESAIYDHQHLNKFFTQENGLDPIITGVLRDVVGCDCGGLQPTLKPANESGPAFKQRCINLIKANAPLEAPRPQP